MFQCSAACGAGVETRQVICVRLQNVTYVKVDGSLCDDNLRMTDTKNCTGHNCWGIWFAGPWGKVRKLRSHIHRDFLGRSNANN